MVSAMRPVDRFFPDPHAVVLTAFLKAIVHDARPTRKASKRVFRGSVLQVTWNESVLTEKQI
jgi:hypothetical protein